MNIKDNGSRECFQLFCRKFGKEPEWLIRCPGRVNLIGEHIDYSHYSVLPMAIADSTWIAVGNCDRRKMFLENADSRYAPFCMEIGDSFSNMNVKNNALKWYHYFLAGWRGILTKLVIDGGNDHDAEVLKHAKGMCAVVGSRIPPNGGLSSSSALVCAASLATICLQTGQSFEHISKKELAEIAIRSERFIGMEGGGMDQACECLAQSGNAMRIDFAPFLHWTYVQLPKNALFAVLSSGRECNKGAESHYNERVVECRIAAQVIAKRSGCLAANGQREWHSIRTLRDAATLLGLADKPAKMLPLVAQYLSKNSDEMKAYSRTEICEILECTDEQLAKYSLNASTKSMKQFWLEKRATHVFAEAGRVLEFQKVCESNQGREALAEIAALMNSSHKSCAELFECSCPELDSTVKKCLEVGCLGARLTGAGWGGCVVALVDRDDKEMVEAKELDILFWSEPCAGIEAINLSKSIK